MFSGALAAVSPLRIPLQALVVALAGAGMAWLCLNDHWLLAAAATAAVIGLGVLCDAIGRAVLVRNPVLAAYLFEGWLLIPLAVAVLASAGLIVLAIESTLPEKDPAGKPTSTETKELVAAVSAGITSFLTAGFVAWAGDAKDSQLADHIKGRFRAKFTRKGKEKDGMHGFAAGSEGEQWVYSEEFNGVEGWGWAARRERARGVAEALK